MWLPIFILSLVQTTLNLYSLYIVTLQRSNLDVWLKATCAIRKVPPTLSCFYTNLNILNKNKVNKWCHSDSLPLAHKYILYSYWCNNCKCTSTFIPCFSVMINRTLHLSKISVNAAGGKSGSRGKNAAGTERMLEEDGNAF